MRNGSRTKMAAKNSHVQDNSVAERRLRPIYEWLDSGNPKKALQETDKVLKKTPNLQCAKALKALSLLQLGREGECVVILNNLTEENPSDNSTLQAMTICYRDLNQLEKVCNLYEKAVQQDQNNEELCTHLFMSYVRTSNFKMQQQTAMSLYKMKNKNPYYCWAVMSIVLQATRGPGSSDTNKKNVLLSLAERMIVKLISENKLEAEQEVQLYLMILELQHKYAEALTILDSPLGSKLMCTSTDLNRIQYLIELKHWTEMATFCADLLNANIDRWDIWQFYLTAMFETVDNTVENHGSTNLSSLEEVVDKIHEFISSLIEHISGDNIFESGSGYQLRGPYLARFELYKRLKNLKYDPGQLLGDIFELFVEYFRIFGHKSCVVNDLKIYLHLLTCDRRLLLSSRLLSDVGITESLLPTSENQMKRHISAIQLSRLLGNHQNFDVDFLRNIFVAFLIHFKNGAGKFGLEKLPTDQGPADAYALVSAHILFDLARKLNQSEALLTALAFLEAVLLKSPSNFHAKLLTVRLYHLLGAPLGAQHFYEALDTKHLQLDSLGFLHCALMYPTGIFSLTSAIFDTTLKFFSTNYRDSVDHLTFSYKFGSFLKLEEFMNFRERLNNSLHYTMTAIDKMLLEVMLSTNIKTLNLTDASPKNNNINWDELKDNNDYTVYVSWNPEEIKSAEQTRNNTKTSAEILFEQNKDLTKLRAALLYCISSALDYLKNATENRDSNAKNLKQALSDFINNYKQIQQRNNTALVVETSLSDPLPSRLNKQLLLPWESTIGCLIRLLLSNHTQNCVTNDVELHFSEDSLKQSLKELVDNVKTIIKEQNDSDDSLWMRREHLECIVNCLELVSICCILSGVCYEVFRPAQAAPSGKKSKRKVPQAATEGAHQGTATSTRAREELSSIIGALTLTCTTLEQVLGDWRSTVSPKSLSEQFGALRITSSDVCVPEVQENVFKNIKNSHSSALSEFKALLLGKIKFLNSLNC